VTSAIIGNVYNYTYLSPDAAGTTGQPPCWQS